jgi:NAD(P)-dependent dehydrogenase (short-subunit alcohol dehydrogenase family)
MKPRGTGSIVLFSSMYGIVVPDPRIYRAPLAPNPIDYGASKAALLQMARYFAMHYGPAGIRFNCVTPGPFSNPALQKSMPDFMQALSDKTALRRIGQNHEIVGPTLFLLGDGASYVTGHSLVVDGGWTVW